MNKEDMEEAKKLIHRCKILKLESERLMHVSVVFRFTRRDFNLMEEYLNSLLNTTDVNTKVILEEMYGVPIEISNEDMKFVINNTEHRILLICNKY